MRKKDQERLTNSFDQLKHEEFIFELIEKYNKNKDNSGTFQTLSDKTTADIDFNELFMVVDRTNSRVGQQYLYNQLRNIPTNAGKNKHRERLIRKFNQDEKYRTECQGLLEKLKKNDSYYITTLFQEEHLKPPKWFLVIKLLAFTSLLSLILLWFNSVFIILFLSVFIVNIGIHYWNKKNLYQYLGAIPQLLRLNFVAAKLFKKESLKVIKPDLENSIKVLDEVKRRMSFFQVEARLQGDSEAVFWGILELVKTMFLLEPILLFSVLKKLNTRRDEIHQVFSFVGEVDTIISITSLRKGFSDHCLPTIDEECSQIVAQEIYHPLIPNCIKNNIEVNKKSILLTGSNMSGKTSFIRAIGINIITGLTLNTCFAKSITIPRTCIYSAIRISDDLLNDKSYYFEEVLTIKQMIESGNQTNTNLFLLDEIFKGTNTIERIAAGKAVLSSIAKNKNLVFVSTHDIELADMLSKEYDLYHFSEVVDGKSVDFDYKLKEGKLKNRNAIRILQINDYPDNIVKEAMEVAEKLDKAALK